jgi:hypothetical protein
MRSGAGNVEVGRLMEFLRALGQDVKITVMGMAIRGDLYENVSSLPVARFATATRTLA